jgi:hypothetical protein
MQYVHSLDHEETGAEALNAIIAGYFCFSLPLNFEVGGRAQFQANFLTLTSDELQFPPQGIEAFHRMHDPKIHARPRGLTLYGQPEIDFSCGPIFKTTDVEQAARCCGQFFSEFLAAPMFVFNGDQLIEVYFMGRRTLPPSKVL